MVEQAIASYFADIYKRSDHIQVHLAQEVDEDIDIADEMINTTAMFSLEDIREATFQSNFYKRLGPDCLNWNLVSRNEQLGTKVIQEIAEAPNNCQIPVYQKVGRLVPL
jgi:hypothetical protein